MRVRPVLLLAGFLVALSPRQATPAWLVRQAAGGSVAGGRAGGAAGAGQGETDLATRQKLRAETEKLEEEIRALHETNAAPDSRAKWLTAWFAAVGSAAVTILAGIVGFFIKRHQDRSLVQEKELKNQQSILEARKLSQDKELAREKHLLEVFTCLGDPDANIRVGAVAVLVQRVLKVGLLPKDDPQYDEDRREVPTIVSILIAATKHEPQVENQKYIADGLAACLRARVAADPAPGSESPLLPYDFQGAKLENAWWQRIDARKVDFYGARLVRAGLRNAFLSGAILKGADLSNATLEDARLEDANLQRAILVRARLARARLVHADLRGANLTGADLRGADLTDADLRGTDLTGADLTDATLDGAQLSGAILTGAKRQGTPSGAGMAPQ
jgi:Pentapeptide repeats (8 copies)